MDQLSLYLPGILLAYSAFLLAIISPGPNVLAVMGASMSISRTAGLALAFGVAAGSLAWATLTVLGLSAIVAAYSAALTVIKVAGGLYLLWLAYKAFRAARSNQDFNIKQIEGSHRSQLGYAAQGFIIQMTNPKAALAWIAIVSIGMQKGAPFWVGGIIVAGTFALSLLIHALYALAFSSPAMVALYRRARRTIQTLFGCFFAAAGARLLISRD
ncbi:LysE family translocator [Roseibium sp. HPY-6]|uniref:LysE family translocator n=1 Tax=Roseibium sp. HPY-6 TaxID=3229852 RepID=UPI00338EB34D